MIRRIAIAAFLLVLAGCTTYGGYYRDEYYSDYGYYDGYGYDDGYYVDDGYGYGHGAYDGYYDYGYSSYTPFWSLDRYRCGYYGCSPYWNSYYGRPWSGWSLVFGNHWNYGSWGWYGSGWVPWYGYDYHHPHWHDPRPDPDTREIRPKPPYPENTTSERRSAPGEYVWPSSRQPAGSAPGVQQRPITGPVTPMPKPTPRLRSTDPRRAPATEAPVWRTPTPEERTPPRDRYQESTPAPRTRYQEPPAPRYREPAASPSPRFETSQPRYEQPAPRPQPRYEPRPEPRYEAPQPRYEPRPEPRYEAPQPRYEAPQPRYESRPEPRVEREPARETRSSSQNDNGDDER